MSQRVEPATGAIPSVVYASWGRRFFALILDYFILGMAIALPLQIWPPSPDDILLGFVLVVALVILGGVYSTFLTGGMRGQTVGKRLLGIAVRDLGTHERIGYGRAFVRWFITGLFWTFLPLIPGLVDGLWPLWDSRKQSLHDHVARSIVIRV